jgi:hypothetical protein
MKTASKIGVGIAGLLLIVVVAAVYLWSSLDSLVAGAIEKYGSQVTQTPVEVEGVELALTSGAGAIRGIRVGNPAGFSRDHIFTLGNVSVAVDTQTVTEPVVVINEVLIQAPQVFYEINSQGQSNIDLLKQNIQQATAGSGGAAQAEGEETKLIIRKLVIEGGEIDARIAALGNKDLSANLPRIQMTGIGEKSGGASAAEVAQQVGNVLISKVGPAVSGLGVDKYLGKTAEQAKALLEGGVQDSIKEKAEGLKGLLGN